MAELEKFFQCTYFCSRCQVSFGAMIRGLRAVPGIVVFMIPFWLSALLKELEGMGKEDFSCRFQGVGIGHPGYEVYRAAFWTRFRCIQLFALG